MEDDHILRDILLDAAEEEYAAELASAEQVATSPKFQKQIDKLLKRSNRWNKGRKKPLWKQCIQNAAIFLLVCSIAFGVVMIASPTARAYVIKQWETGWYYAPGILYGSFVGSDLEDVPKYEITRLPPGYAAPGEEHELVDHREIVYKNGAGDALYFEYARIESASTLILKTEDMEQLEVEVNGHRGDLYLHKDPKVGNVIVWYDEQEGLQFTISGSAGREDLLRMAESVSPRK